MFIDHADVFLHLANLLYYHQVNVFIRQVTTTTRGYKMTSKESPTLVVVVVKIPGKSYRFYPPPPGSKFQN